MTVPRLHATSDTRRGDGHKLVIALALGMIASIAAMLLITANLTLTLAFGGGLVVLAFAGVVGARMRPAAGGADESAPEPAEDWSAVLTVADQAGLATAVTDRANRLVCASEAYTRSFGLSPPTRLELDPDAGEALAQQARMAWRDGSGEATDIAYAGRHWRVHVRTIGSGETRLAWHFAETGWQDPAGELARVIAGPVGRVLGNAGIAVGLVGSEGLLVASNASADRLCEGAQSDLTTGACPQLPTQPDEAGLLRFSPDLSKDDTRAHIDVPLSDRASNTAGPGAPNRLVMMFDSGLIQQDDNDPASAPRMLIARLVEHIPFGLAAAGRDGRLLFANPAFRRASGIARTNEAERLPVYPSDLVLREDKPVLADAVRRHAFGNESSSDLTVRLAQSPEEPIMLGLVGVRGAGEVAVLITLADMTEENRLKREVAQQTKMQAVGQLAGGVAHDFNNLLTAIIGTCDLMLERHAPGEEDHQDIEEIKENSNRAASLTRQLLAFSRQQTLEPETIALPAVIAGMTDLLGRLLGARVALDVREEPGVWPVRADKRQVEQVVMNLAVNARDAIRERRGEQASGTLTLTVRPMRREAIRSLGNDFIPEGDYSVLEIEDDGGGIPRALLGKIFEPFFTTKEVGKGTGLGLSTVYGIVKQSGGFIFAENIPGEGGEPRGARFLVFLPAHQATPEEIERLRLEAIGAARVPAKADDRASTGARVLLVEDEDMVRRVAERALVRAGYRVVSASDGEDGLSAFDSSGPFDILISDVVMPGIDGPAMARALRKRAPDLPVLFMSGYAEGQLRDELELAAAHFIAKPFSVREITDKVAAILSERMAMH